jgi:FHA domain/Zinc-ribbon containing domain
MDSHETGTLPGTGSFRCASCDFVVALAPVDELPVCPSCGGIEFRRASLFAAENAPSAPHAHDEDDEGGSWLAEVRATLVEPGQYLAYREGDAVRLVVLSREWTRIGRSLAADIRFDDTTVSRRHALIVRAHDGVRVLDDRSLNGVWVNGERVEWHTLRDGDEVLVGCHALHFLDVARVESVRPSVRESTPG